MSGPMLTRLAVESGVAEGRRRSHCRLVGIPQDSDVTAVCRQRRLCPIRKALRRRGASRFFVCWWYILYSAGVSENRGWIRDRQGFGPRMVRILLLIEAVGVPAWSTLRASDHRRTPTP